MDPQITKHGADLDPRASLSVMHPVTWAVHLLEQAQGSFGPGPPHGASGGGRQLPVCSPGRRGSEPHQALVSQVEWGSHRALVRLAPQNQATLVNGSLHPIQMGFEFPAGGKTGSRRGGGGGVRLWVAGAVSVEETRTHRRRRSSCASVGLTPALTPLC